MVASITIVGITEFKNPGHVPWETDVDGGPALVEFAGRACYQSWEKPNPETATNKGYIKNILKQRHFSVLEHGNVSVYLENISRTLSHEFIRHRHFNYSELSQRYVPMHNAPVIIHPTLEQFRNDIAFKDYFEAADAIVDEQRTLYEEGVQLLSNKNVKGKKAREGSRGVMPANLETKIVVTGNYRAWRHFFAMRASIHADAEIRQLAVEIWRHFVSEIENIFDDFIIRETPDGITYLESPIVEVS